jgi:hypothetical protein
MLPTEAKANEQATSFMIIARKPVGRRHCSTAMRSLRRPRAGAAPAASD